MADIKPGDEVRVFTRYYSLRQPEGGWRGEVVKVGRTLATIRYGSRDEKFRLETGVIDDSYGGIWFRTLEQTARDERLRAATAVLKTHRVTLDFGHSLTLEQVEALAAVFADPDAEDGDE